MTYDFGINCTDMASRRTLRIYAGQPVSTSPKFVVYYAGSCVLLHHLLNPRRRNCISTFRWNSKIFEQRANVLHGSTAVLPHG